MAKRGRPKLENAKKDQYRLRLDDEYRYKLEQLSDIRKESIADILRKGVDMLWNLNENNC